MELGLPTALFRFLFATILEDRRRRLRHFQISHRSPAQRILLSRPSNGGFTLVELSVVIAVILVLAGIASLGVQPYLTYRDARAGGEMLRSVKAAQLIYLSDYPAAPVTTLTPTLLQPYMPNGTWPSLPPVNGVSPTIKCTVFPPVAVLGGATFDPSGSTTDGLWDVGLY